MKYHLVKDFAACQPIQLGGLGTQSLQISNIALLGKWLWQFAGETDPLWKLVIVTKFGCSIGGWSSGLSNDHMGFQFGNTLEVVGIDFLSLYCLRWEVATIFISWMTCGAVTFLFECLSHVV